LLAKLIISSFKYDLFSSLLRITTPDICFKRASSNTLSIFLFSIINNNSPPWIQFSSEGVCKT